MDVITFPINLKTTGGLSILLHGVISLPDTTSYVMIILSTFCPSSYAIMLVEKESYI